MKVQEFKSSIEIDDYAVEVVSVIKNESNNRICADLSTKCKRWKTALNRFFGAIENYPELLEWQETLFNSCENNIFSGVENIDEDNIWYDWEVTQFEDEYYVKLFVNS